MSTHIDKSSSSLCVCVSVIEGVYAVLRDLDHVTRVATDLLDCRIQRLLHAMSTHRLLVLPEDSPVSPEELLLQNDCSEQAAALCW